MTTPAAGQRYWLGDSPPEIGHLLAQAEFLGPDAADLLDRHISRYLDNRRLSRRAGRSQAASARQHPRDVH